MKKITLLVIAVLGMSLQFVNAQIEFEDQTESCKKAHNVFSRPDLFTTSDPATFNNLYREGKLEVLQAALSEDLSDVRPGVEGYYECVEFATQTSSINLFGMANPEEFYDYSKYLWGDNGKYNLPAYQVRTIITTLPSGLTTAPGGHRICAIFVGPVDKTQPEDPRDFYQWYFWEPQTDMEVKIGDWNMDKNGYALVVWVGQYKGFDGNLKHDIVQIIKWDLVNGVPVLVEKSYSEYLLLENPNRAPIDTEPVVISGLENKTVEFGTNTDPSVTGYPTLTDNLDPNPTATYEDVSTQETSGTARFNYVITRTWTAKDASENVSTAVQTITVKDTKDAEMTGEEAIALESIANLDITPETIGIVTATDNGEVASLTYSDNSTQIMDGTINQVNYVITRTWTAIDGVGNESTFVQTITVTSTAKPELVLAPNSKIGLNDDVDAEIAKTIISATDATGLPTVNKVEHYIIAYDKGKVVTVNVTVTSVAGNQTFGMRTITIGSPIITDSAKPHLLKIYRVDSNLQIKYFADGTEDVEIQIINMANGDIVKSVDGKVVPGDNLLIVPCQKLNSLNVIRVIDKNTSNVQTKAFIDFK